MNAIFAKAASRPDRRHRSPGFRTGLVVALALMAGLLATGRAPAAARLDAGVEIETIGVDAVSPGMTGIGWTVVRGTEPEEFQVEILGVLHNVFPKQDVVIARLTGLNLDETGVIAGMSGSPVTIDGKLLGAVAYQLADFNREAIAGIMPIDSMLRVARLGDGDDGSRLAELSSRQVMEAAGRLLAGRDPGPLDELRRASGTTAGLRPIATPVSLGGFHPAVADRLSPIFEAMGWQPMVGGTVGQGRSVSGSLVPGSALGVQLVRGDINIAATGTVTYRDADRILAFGHPFLQGGAVDFPMVAADVITVLNRLQASQKLTATGNEVIGAVRQDRFPGILGVLGAQPRTIPVRLEVDAGSGNREEYAFELVSDKMLSPIFLFFGMANGVQNVAKAFGDSAIEVEAEFVLGRGLPPVRVSNLFSSENQAFVSLSSTIAAIFSFLYDNDFEAVQVREIDLGINVRDDRKVARISRVLYDRSEVRPGQDVNLTVWLKPYREPEVAERITVTIPPGTTAGPLSLLVGDAESISRQEQTFLQGEFVPKNLQHLVRLLNSIRRNDRIYAQASRPDEGAFFKGEVMPSLPPSMLSVLSAHQGSGDFVRLNQSVLLEEEKPVDYVVSGHHRIELEVRRR